MAPRLKVFTWSDGFHAFTVAASSRPKALAAWGMERDIFASGLAHEIKEGPDYEAALAQPGEVIERGLSVDVGEVAPRRKPKPAEKAKTDGPAGPSKAERERVRALEAELRTLEREQAAARRELEAEAARVARSLDSLSARQARARDRLRERLDKARAALRAG